MAVFKYFAVDRGDLISGHSEGTEYLIEIPLSEWTPYKTKKESVIEPMEGPVHTLLLSIRRYFSFSTTSTGDATMITELEEMFDSVSAGETFVIDPYGTIATPGTFITVVMKGKHSSSRDGQIEFKFSARVEKYEA